LVMLDTKMFSLGFLLVALAHQALARVNQVEVKLYGDITSSLDALASGLKSIEAGRKVVVKCAGQFRQEVKFSASFLKDGSRRSYLHPEGLGGQEFQFTPEVDDNSENTQLKCEVNSINDNNLLAENATDVLVVFPPQPNKEQFVAAEGVGHRGEAKLSVRALPLVLDNTLVWETPVNFMEKITTSSRQPGYQLTTRRVSQTELEVRMVVEKMSAADFGPHSLIVENQLGRQMYKVRFFEPEVARVFISPLPEEVVIGTPNFVTCRSDGGNPPPKLEARIEVAGVESRQLIPAGEGEGRGSHQERNFTLDPRVSERTDRDTFAVCEAVQKAGGNVVYEGVIAQEQLNIFYPPQHQDIVYVGANVDEPAEVTLVVEAFPRPRRRDIKWSFAESESDKYRMEVSFNSASTVSLTMIVTRVEEHDYSVRHSVSVQNKYGKEVFYFQVLKPIPTWVFVLIGVGVLLVIVVLVTLAFCASRRSKRKQSRSTAQTQASTSENKTPFLAESAT